MKGIFAHFTEHQIQQLKSCARARDYKAGQKILSEGGKGHEPYYLQRGQIRLERQTPYGEFTLGTLLEGELFGEVSFVDRGVRSMDAYAATGSHILVFDPDTIDKLAAEDPAFHVALYWAFWRSLSRKLRSTNETLASFFTGSPSGPTMASFLGRPAGEIQVDLETKRAFFQEQKLTRLEINFLSTLSTAKELKPGQVIFHDGDDGEHMYAVLKGRVMISKQIPGAGEEALAFLERGDFFGEMALIDNEPRSADAKADTGGAVVLSISREVLETILDIKKVSSVRLLTTLCGRLAKRLREVNEKIIGWFILSGGSLGKTQTR